MVQVREALEEAVVALEAALHRPRVLRAGGGAVGVTAEVPLADGEGGIARVAEDLGRSGDVGGELAPVAGIAGVVLADVADARCVRVDPGEQGGPGGRAHRVDVKVREADSLSGKAVEVGGVDLAAVAAEVGEPDVVDEDDHDVRRTVGGHRPARPARLGPGHRAPDPAFEAGVRRGRLVPHALNLTVDAAVGGEVCGESVTVCDESSDSLWGTG